MTAPHNHRVAPEIIHLRDIPGFQTTKFYESAGPVTLDHSLNPIVMKAERFTLSQMELLIRNAQSIYVYQCLRTWEDIRDDLYTLRYAIVEPKLAQLVTDINMKGTILDKETFMPLIATTLNISIDRVADLGRAWGRDEVIRQLGEYLMIAIEQRCVGDPNAGPASEHTHSLDPHPSNQ